jgi:transcriptional regulator with XRE-family HTH domain
MTAPRIAVADLLSAGTPVYPHDAAAVLQEACGFVARQKMHPRAVPVLEGIAIDSDGQAWILDAARCAEDEEVRQLAKLLRRLLANPGFAVEPIAGERLLNLATKGSAEGASAMRLREFAAALGRFDPAWRGYFLRDLFERAQRHPQPRSERPKTAPAKPEPIGTDEPTMADQTKAGPAAVEPPSIELADIELPEIESPRIEPLNIDDLVTAESLRPDEPPRNQEAGPEFDKADPWKERAGAPGRALAQPTEIADLRRWREASGLTLETIATRIKISPGLLYELEDGSLKSWPPGVYRKGWIRAYALEAGIDPDRLLGMLEPLLHTEAWSDIAIGLQQSQSDVSPSAELAMASRAPERRGHLVTLVLSLLIALIVLGLAAHWGGVWSGTRPPVHSSAP